MQDSRKAGALAIGIVAVVATVWVIAGYAPAPYRGCAGTATSPWLVSDATSQLGGSFSPGSIQSFGSNGSAVWVAGIGSFNNTKTVFPSSPLLGRLGGPNGAAPANLTAEIQPYFHDGGVFVPAWNGSGWLVVGQSGWGEGGTQAAVVFWKDGVVQNLSGLFVPFFAGRGIYIAGWNGSAFLIGGNSSSGAALVSFSGHTVVDLSPLLHRLDSRGWVQMLGWNGTAWMIGGYGILASYSHGRMTDLWTLAPYSGGGVYGMDWNGRTWLLSGTPTRLEFWDGARLLPGPSLPASFDAWVNVVVSTHGGWIVAGGGHSSNGTIAPELVWLGSETAGPEVDLTTQLPQAFLGGQVQFGGVADAYPVLTILLVGQGGIMEPTQTSHGAVAALTLRCG